MAIHPTAVIDPQAEIDPTAEIGAYAVIDGPVTVAARARIYHHAYLTGWTEIGAECEVHPFAVVGHLPQDFHFEGHRSYCRIGAGTVIREYVSIHRGTDPDSVTSLGEKCFLLAHAHVGHNCAVGDRVTMINGVNLGGHTTVGQGALFSICSATHQFTRVGEYAMLAPDARAPMDALPYMTVQGRNAVSGVNVVGMKRNGFSKDEIAEIKQAHRLLYRSGLPLSKAVDEFEVGVQTRAGRTLLEFVRGESRRGLGAGPRHAYRHSRYNAAGEGGESDPS